MSFLIAPSVSVIIPVYNRIEKGQRSIDAVLRQTLRPNEIIVVDDASEPPFQLSNAQSCDPRIKLIRNVVNWGAAQSRNIGIEAVSHPWVAFCDSDDTWRHDKIEKQFRALSEVGCAEYVFCASNIRIVNDNNNVRPYNRGLPRLPIDRWMLLGGNTLQCSTFLVQTTQARHYRFRPDAAHEDWDFVLRILNSGARLCYVDECLVDYDASVISDRVSRNISIEKSMAWLNAPDSPVKVTVADKFYLRTLFRRHIRQNMRGAVSQLLKIERRIPGGAVGIFTFLFHHIAAAIARRLLKVFFLNR